MSDPKKVVKCKMDGRCPRKLASHPEQWCPLAVLRLKALRNAGRELTEEEESLLPGCPWAVNHQVSNYCFFKYISEYAEDKPPSELEIASILNLSVETVKKIEKAGISKMREAQVFKSLQDNGEPVIGEGFSPEDSLKIYK
jgi:hypothetical protein